MGRSNAFGAGSPPQISSPGSQLGHLVARAQANEITAQTTERRTCAPRRHRRGCPPKPSSASMQPQPNTLVRMALPPIPTPPRTRTRRRGPMVPPITPPPRRGCKPRRPVASPITPPARRVTPRPPRTPPPHSTKRTKHSSPANGTPEAKAALKLVDAAARGGDADLLALSSKFWTDATETRTPRFLEALRRTDPARWRLVKQHMKQFTAIRGLLLAEVAERATRTHATWRPRSESYHFAPSPAQ